MWRIFPQLSYMESWNFSTWQFFLHEYNSWYSWQILGLIEPWPVDNLLIDCEYALHLNEYLHIRSNGGRNQTVQTLPHSLHQLFHSPNDASGRCNPLFIPFNREWVYTGSTFGSTESINYADSGECPRPPIPLSWKSCDAVSHTFFGVSITPILGD